ncbi:Arylsulfatase [Klebsiella pneumoniae]|nr:Arylsulfatase [Klebsiella pneumoniae]
MILPSEAYARQMNSWIKATPKEQPARLAFTAPHDPAGAGRVD